MLLSSLRKMEAKQQRLIILTVLMMELVMLKRGFHVLLNVIMELFICLSIYQHNLQETLFLFLFCRRTSQQYLLIDMRMRLIITRYITQSCCPPTCTYNYWCWRFRFPVLLRGAITLEKFLKTSELKEGIATSQDAEKFWNAKPFVIEHLHQCRVYYWRLWKRAWSWSCNCRLWNNKRWN